MPNTSLENLSSRELSQNLSKAKLMADNAPIVITERNEPAYVLMSYKYFTDLDNNISSISNNDANNELSEIRKMVENLSIEFELMSDTINKPSIPVIDKNLISQLTIMNEILKETPEVLGKTINDIMQNQQENMSNANSIILDNFMKRYDMLSERMLVRFMTDNGKPINDLMFDVKELSKLLIDFKTYLVSRDNNKTWWQKLFS